ncbi:MAG: type IV secretion system DNA-binding domain-containing protein [Clostridia bacterium]
MAQPSVLKGLQIANDIPYRDPDSLFALAGANGLGNSAFLPIGDRLLERHMLLLGGAATGKTNLLLHLARNLRANLSPQDALVIFDATGAYHAALCQQGDVVIAQDERAQAACWNLFEELPDNDRLLEEASALCDLLFAARIAGAARPLYPTAARDLLMALIVYLKRRGEPELCNNHALRELIDGFDAESMCEILQSEPELRAYAYYLTDPEGERTQGVVAALQQAARELLSGSFGAQGALGMRSLVRARGGKAIFICYDAACGALARPVYAALCDLCLREALSVREVTGHIYLLLDGVSVLPALPHLPDALLLGREKGLRALLSATGVSALEDRYGAAFTAMLAAIGTTVAFCLHDRASRSYIKNLHGRHRVVESYHSAAQARGVIEQVVDEYVVGDEDLTALQTGESIIAALHYPPFRFRAKPYGSTER